ncbi:helix-turn-helix domain-containing protein [Pedobacter sp. UBA5917]|jgi:AraC-like DNA-binding protein|uniref:helix-turn-helix domain-containing protein n=1 Tax=Pedobacter sp. UBA5917 TaxID=1947061 RepID=UPI0025D6C856|nr:helix-turn-helix domain-containing protein [Pedobacter sp. UBA5917]
MTEIFDNIRKLYRFLTPHEGLSPYVEFFSETDLAAAKNYIQNERFTVKLFPSFTPTIWLNLGSKYQLYNGKHRHQVNENTDVLVLRSEIIERQNAPADNIFTVKFLPGGFETIFGISQTKIAGNVISLDELIPNQVISKIKQAPDFETRVKLWEDYLLEKKAKNTNGHYLFMVQRSIDTFLDAGMKLSTAQLADKIYMGEKSLNRYFNKVVGTGPKNYFNILRARTALTQFMNKESIFSPQDYGYYDMSHFYRNTVLFTGTRIAESR